jgi:Collagen triple helix repeat (20 copies)
MHKRAIAACALVALGVGATSATASSLITSANIKDGTIHMRDLAPTLQKKIRRAGKPGPQGANGANGATGLNGANGVKGQDGTNGVNGAPGAPGAPGAQGSQGIPGKDGKDGVRYDRIASSLDGGKPGEVSIHDGYATFGVPTQDAYAQIRSYPKGLKVSELEKLSFKANASDEGIAYLSVTTTGNGVITFSPNTQPGGEQTNEWVTYDVLDGTARWNDPAGNSPDLDWNQILTMAGNKHIKAVSLIAGAAQPVGDDGGEVLYDDLTVNDEVIDFN